jgi:hypothetical protein
LAAQGRAGETGELDHHSAGAKPMYQGATMRIVPRKRLAAVMGAIVGLAALTAEAQAGAYAMITIQNQNDVPIHYEFRWGSGDWAPTTIYPGTYVNHWYPLDASGLAPIPSIRFDYLAGDGDYSAKEYSLDFFASNAQGFDAGKLYSFRYVRTWYLDLYEA